MIKLMKTGMILVILLSGVAKVEAQFVWPEDPEMRAKAEEKNVLYTDELKAGNYTAAVKNLRWLLNNTPKLSKSIYQNGAKIYQALAEESNDDAVKLAYVDTLLTMYDLRIQYFGEEANVMDYKAYSAYKFLKGEYERMEELYNIFSRTYELNGNDLMDVNAVGYMDVVRRLKKINPNAIADEEILDIYDNLSEVIAYKKEQGKNLKRLEVIQDNMDKLLAAVIDVDCDFIETKLAPKYKLDTTDIKLAKKIFQLQLSAKCSDSDLFLAVAKEIFRQEPTYGLAKIIAAKSMGKEQWEEALVYLEKGMEMADEESEKSKMHMDMGTSYTKLNDKYKARDHYLKSASLDPTNKVAYEQVGLMYFQSFDGCKKGKNPVEDRAVFIAAYNMFQKAGNSKLMAAAKEQFPSKEDVFTYTMAVGDPVEVGCWINSTVSIATRD